MDPAVDVLATLITEQLRTVLPEIITQVINGDENTRCYPKAVTGTKGVIQGETSKKRKRCRTKKSRDPVIYTEAIPLRQMAVAPESEGHKHYAGKAPLCTNCHYHHSATTSCRQCTRCGKMGHWGSQCRSPMNLICTPKDSKFPQCATCNLHHTKNKPCRYCLNCGKKGHWSRDCNNPPTHNQNPGNTTYPLPRHSKDCYVCGLSEHIARDCPVRVFSANPTHSEEVDALPTFDASLGGYDPTGLEGTYFGLSVLAIGMWWDGVWAGRRLDSGVCPIYKHTELDDTGVVNEVKVMHRSKLKLLDCILGCQIADLVDFWRSTYYAMDAIHF
ncbi:hypothetical protein E3N88_04447 [Mikania micrantha]|uniref:CCHC-type domain-containing protein n=1 Tax=Mikania micrantha TaxID=192012 RepID=A0A5N6PUE7_9ASTR|nr:hypothetical protein E3N88_04447 [Mikania micrantha]